MISLRRQPVVLSTLALTVAVALPATAALLGGQAAAVAGLAAALPAAASDPYREGQQALDDARWADAARSFERVVAAGGANADAALYWLAWAEHKAGRRAEALSALDRLVSAHAASPWRDDAEALRIEITGGRTAASGDQRVDGAAEEGDLSGDDELKLLAIHSLMGADPERALPALRKVLASASPRQLREQALFVLSQHDSPEALALLQDVARGRVQPDLQLRAIDFLGMSGEDEALRFLDEVYRTSRDRAIREKVLESYLMADASERVLVAAQSETDPALRAKAVELLGVMDASAELRQLYTAEKEVAVRGKILESLAIAGDVDFLREAARDSDAALRRKAVQGLGMQDHADVRGTLQAIYRTADRETRMAVLDAFMMQDDAAGLIAVARSETDRELKRRAIERLAMLDSEEAQAFLLEALDR